MAKKPPKIDPRCRYTVALGERICHELSNGKPLKQICREIKLDWSTVYRWRVQFPEFGKELQIARDMGEEALLAECQEIADDTSQDYKEVVGADGQPRVAFDKEHVQRSKLRIETRLKLLAKWNPSKWGDKVETTHKGDPSAPVALIVNGSDVHG